jgi:hypothetical protein
MEKELSSSSSSSSSMVVYDVLRRVDLLKNMINMTG